MPYPKEEAQKVLRAYYGPGRVAGTPVDPVAIARSLGINVYGAELENSLSGMIVRTHYAGGVDMFLNNQHAPARQRFTAAHEIGHYREVLLNSPDPQAPFIHQRSQLASCGTSRQEIFANQFGAELLMPEDEVRQLHRLGLDEVAMGRRFNVSLDAMRFRLVNLRLT